MDSIPNWEKKYLLGNSVNQIRMLIKKIFLKYKSFKSGITIVEIIVVFAIVLILISITTPSLRSFILKNQRDSYLSLVNSFFESIKRDTRRYGISCTLKTIEINSYPNDIDDQVGGIPSFQLTCSGNNDIKSTLKFQVPKISKNLFQKVSGDIIFTPKGQAFIKNLNVNNKSFVLAVGIKDNSSQLSESMRCILINQPSGLINNGTFVSENQSFISQPVSIYDNSLLDTDCSKD